MNPLYGDRFVISATLGVGGMGVVYEAFDRERSATVALKALHQMSPAALYRFKREFRALADLSHPNLVSLYELFGQGDDWFFTMELVRGVSLLDHLGNGETGVDVTAPTAVDGAPAVEVEQRAARPLDWERLEPALHQLVSGLSAIHAAGRLHRDIKPSNVLVTGEGRVVICDFGLVTSSRAEVTDANHVVGTASYMSPEQAAGLPLDEASDWYSVGVILYQALTGKLPFAGSSQRVLLEKQMHEPAPPSSLSDVPPRLDRLCVELLRMVPEERAGAREVLAALGGAPAVVMQQPRFVGRHAALAELRSLYTRAMPVTVCVRGASGIGKTRLVREFLDELDVLTLEGRCYERETVPFKALDSLIDALSTALRRLPRSAWVVPSGVQALVRLFPVLRRVEAIAEAPLSLEVPDPQELLRRAAQALNEIVAQLAPVVLHLDDVQWGDRDSASFLAALMRPPNRVLLLLSQRTDEPSPLLDKLADVHFIDLEALTPSEARELAVLLVGTEEAESIAKESGGSPLFVYELARPGKAGGSSYEEVLAARVRELPDEAQRLLTVVAMAGGPIPVPVASQAAELESDEHAALSLLRAEQLVRWRMREIETFHDRIRSSVTASLSDEEKRRCHERLVVALEAVGQDPEALVEHLIGAGQHERAAKQAEVAADRAMAALAFDRAARLYRFALSLESARALWIKLGDALVNAGRGFDAAQAYEHALTGAATTETLELRRRMAEQLLRSGHFDAGLSAVRDVLAEVGMSLAPTPERALASLVLGRARIRLRGLDFREHAVSQEELTRIDVCWSIATAVGMTDFIVGADFQTRHLLLALAAGEPERVARGLAIEAAYSSGSGGKSRARTERLLRAARALAMRVGSAHLDGLTETVVGITAFLEGRWSEARAACARGETIFRDRCRGVAWELASAEFFGLGALYYLGAMGEVAERVPQRLREAEERGDLYRATGLRSWRTNVAWLAGDEPDTARAQIVEASTHWTRHGFHLQHYFEIFSHCQIDLYCGDGARAHRRITDAWPLLRRSMLLRIQNTRVEAWYVRARAALAVGSPELWRSAERDARRLERENMAWAHPYALAVRAAVAWQRSGGGRRELEHAIAGFDGANMMLFAAAARRHLGVMTGRQELVEAADAHMKAQRIVDPLRMARMLVPFDRRPSV